MFCNSVSLGSFCSSSFLGILVTSINVATVDKVAEDINIFCGHQDHPHSLCSFGDMIVLIRLFFSEESLDSFTSIKFLAIVME